MTKSNELQIGKAGEYLACADIIMKGMIAYPSEQGLPYDVVVDCGSRLLKCQVKTTEGPRTISQRNKESKAYIFNIKRHGKNNQARYTESDVDFFALVELETRTVGYVLNGDMPATINLRVDGLRGSYYDEKGIRDHARIKEQLAIGMSQVQAARHVGISQATANRMAQADYVPHVTGARYFSDIYRDLRWFEAI